jgi:membrane protein implicated in regulation of membrane protease activity
MRRDGDSVTMRIAKPLLLVTTPIGVAAGLYEGWRLAGGLVFLMTAFVALIGTAMWSVVRVVRREQQQQREPEQKKRTGPD